MMKDEELIWFEHQFGVGLPLVVGEFDLVGTIEDFDDGAYLAAQQSVRWHIRQERDNRILTLSEEDACWFGGDFSQHVAEMRHVLEPIVGVPAPVPIAPAQGPATSCGRRTCRALA